MLSNVSRWSWRESVLVYILASVCDFLLLVPQSQLATRAGQQLDLALPIVIHQAIVGVLVVFLAVSGGLRTWRWQYVATSVLFSVYVAVRMAARFVSGLNLVSLLASQGIIDYGAVQGLYLYGLASAATYTAMILALRRSSGRLILSRSPMQALE